MLEISGQRIWLDQWVQSTCQVYTHYFSVNESVVCAQTLFTRSGPQAIALQPQCDFPADRQKTGIRFDLLTSARRPCRVSRCRWRKSWLGCAAKWRCTRWRQRWLHSWRASGQHWRGSGRRWGPRWRRSKWQHGRWERNTAKMLGYFLLYDYMI